MPPKVAALSREVLEPALTSAGMTAHDIRALLRSDAWRDLDSRNSEVVVLWDFSQSDGISQLGTSDIAKTFNSQGDHVSSIRPKAHPKKKLPYRPPALDSHQEENVIHFIQDSFDSGNSVTQRELLNYVGKNLAIILAYGWLRAFLDRHSSQVRRTIVHAQEHV
jgi:hypothetical protein